MIKRSSRKVVGHQLSGLSRINYLWKLASSTKKQWNFIYTHRKDRIGQFACRKEMTGIYKALI